MQFLGKSVPDVPFTRLNDGPTLEKTFHFISYVMSRPSINRVLCSSADRVCQGMSLWAATAAVTAGLGYWSYQKQKRVLDFVGSLRGRTAI